MSQTDAQLVAHILEQEENLRFESFDSNVAFAVGTLIRDTFLKDDRFVDKGIVISISLFTGHTLFSCAAGAEGYTGPDNWMSVLA